MKSLDGKGCLSYRSHRILNAFTLQIKDKELAAEYQKTCAENFDSLFFRSVFIVVVYSLIRLGSMDWSSPSVPSILGTAYHFPTLILWGFMRGP